ncbi:MAG: type IV pilus modification PilV family protein [Planctomycetota bacterium]|jgi:Tfp pilus assembly protein PilV
MMRRAGKENGFSLVETLVAGTILSATVLAVLAASTASIGATRLNRQYEQAASLAEKQFSLIDFFGIDEFVDAAEFEGTSENTDPVFYWQIETEYQEIDSLYRVTTTVTWMDQARPRSLVVETMLNGESLVLEEEGEGETDSGGGDSGGGSAPSGGGSNSGPSGGGGSR